ncbi:hypothetical protein ACFSKV_05830 [Shivajiella indica]|uniref:Uncharacterized protein n=2 Tax=Shivajiella indica TaxID=872115 RepID=A0ABW5B618_9BACT
MKINQLLVLIVLFSHFSCVTYRDFSKSYGISGPIDFTDPDVNKHLELGEEYKIKTQSQETLELAIIQINDQGLIGIPIKKDSDKPVEIPFNTIKEVKKKDYKRDRRGVLTSIPLLAIMSVVLLTATLLIITTSN